MPRNLPSFSTEPLARSPNEPEWDTSILAAAANVSIAAPVSAPLPGRYAGLHSPTRDVTVPRGYKVTWRESGLLQWVRSIPAGQAFLLWAGVGTTLLIAAVALGLGIVQSPSEEGGLREVGFIWSLSWSLSFLFLFPFAAYLMVSVIQWLPDVIEEMVERGMLRDMQYQLQRSPAHIVDAWLKPRRNRTLLLWLSAGGIFAATFVGTLKPNDFYTMGRLSFGLASNVDTSALKTYDWRNAALIPQTKQTPHSATRAAAWASAANSTASSTVAKSVPEFVVAPLANVLFDFFAWVWQSLALSAMFAFFVYIVDLSIILRREPEDCDLAIVPYFSGQDQRRGFELFEGPLKQVLMIGAIAYLDCNLARINAAYLESGIGGKADGPPATVWDFAKGAVIEGFSSGGEHSKAAAAFLVNLSLDLPTILATVATLTVFVVCFVMFAGAVQAAAVRANRNARVFFSMAPDQSISGMSPDHERLALGDMQMWPLVFPTPYLLYSLFGVALASLLFYQLGLYLFGVALLVAVGTVIVRFIKRS